MTRTLVPSWSALARRSSPRGLAAVALATLTTLGALAIPACKSGGAATGSDDPALAAIQARIPPLTTTEFGPTPGFLAGGVLWADAPWGAIVIVAAGADTLDGERFCMIYPSESQRAASRAK